jgi:hypothetical protein
MKYSSSDHEPGEYVSATNIKTHQFVILRHTQNIQDTERDQYFCIARS